MLQDLIDTFEELKKHVFLIDRGTNGIIVLKFNNDNFYHLVGLHKTNIHMFFPEYIKTQDKKYKHMKKNVKKFDNILKNQIKDKNSLEMRIKTFSKIKDLLNNSSSTTLYNLKEKVAGSVYNGDYGLMKIYEEDICCLLGLKKENENDKTIYCAPQSWMASNRGNKLITYKRPIYMKTISVIPINMYNEKEKI